MKKRPRWWRRSRRAKIGGSTLNQFFACTSYRLAMPLSAVTMTPLSAFIVVPSITSSGRPREPRDHGNHTDFRKSQGEKISALDFRDRRRGRSALLLLALKQQRRRFNKPHTVRRCG